MPLHFLTDDERWVVKLRLNTPYQVHEIPDGLQAHTINDMDYIPSTYAPRCYASDDYAVFRQDVQSPNPYAYKKNQHVVFAWAKRNIHDSAYHTYGLHGHQLKAKIFHAFVAMNVMAAMHPINILGDHWRKVVSNLHTWRKFVDGIIPAQWEVSAPDGVNYRRLALALGGFVTLDEDWRPVMDWNDTGWAVFNREHGGHDGLTHGPDIRRATNITVVPPADITAWEHSARETSEPLFVWNNNAYRAYLKQVATIVPITEE